MLHTGYFAKVATRGRCYSQVHIVHQGVPICSYRPAKSMGFQWCASGVYLRFVECKACKEKAKKINEIIKG